MVINCVAYVNGSRLGELPVETISDYLKKPDCFVWVALSDPTRKSLIKCSWRSTCTIWPLKMLGMAISARKLKIMATCFLP